MPTQQQITAFNRSVADHIRGIQNQVYRPNYFIQLMTVVGAYEAACQVIQTTNIPEGFTTLFMANRLDLTIEAFVVRYDSQNPGVFDQQIIEQARRCLAEVGYHI